MTEARVNSPPGSSAGCESTARNYCTTVGGSLSSSNSETVTDDSDSSLMSSPETLVSTPTQSVSSLPYIYTPSRPSSAEVFAVGTATTTNGGDQGNPSTTSPTAQDALIDGAHGLNAQAACEAVVVVKVSPTMIFVDYQDPSTRNHFEPINGPMTTSFPAYCPEKPTKVEVYMCDNPYSKATEKRLIVVPSPVFPATRTSESSTDGFVFSQVWPAGMEFTLIVQYENASAASGPAEGFRNPRLSQNQGFPWANGLNRSTANQLMQPMGGSLPYQGFVVPQHLQVGGGFGQQMPTQASAFNPVPPIQGAPTYMRPNFFPNTGMHAASIANNNMHATPPVNYAPAQPMQQLGYPMPPCDYGWSSELPHSGSRTSLPRHGAHPGPLQPGHPISPPRYGSTSGQQPSVSAPHAQDHRSPGEGALSPPERPRHQSEAESSFDREPDKVLVFQADGTWLDLKRILIATEHCLDENSINRLLDELSQLHFPVFTASKCEQLEEPRGNIRFQTLLTFHKTVQAAHAINYLRATGAISGVRFLLVEIHKPKFSLAEWDQRLKTPVALRRPTASQLT